MSTDWALFRAHLNQPSGGGAYPPPSRDNQRVLHVRPGQAGPGASESRRSVILEADDLGLLYSFNEGIRSAYCSGCLTSTCIRANGWAFEHAIHEALPACPGIGLGVHLCLNEGECVAPPESLPLLLARGRQFRSGFCRLIRLARTPEGREQIEREFRAQIEKVLATGVRLDHLNSHRHVHMIPNIFRTVCRLANEYKIPCVRLVRELPYRAGGLGKRLEPMFNSNLVKHQLLNWYARFNEAVARAHHVATPDYFVGVNYTSYMTLATIRDGLQAAPYGSVEVLLHPAIAPDSRDADCPDRALLGYVSAPGRVFELRALRQPELCEFLLREEWTATSFSKWVKSEELRRPAETEAQIPEKERHICAQLKVSGPPWVSAAREDSRAFAELALASSRPGQRVLDLGTGTGIIGICLAQAGREVTASDISGAAVRTAAANARRCDVAFKTHRSDLLESVPGQFDLIAFNLPYSFRPDTFLTNLAKNMIRRVPFVRRTSGLAMPRPVVKYHQQLVERLMRQAPAHLNPGGQILLHVYASEVAALRSVLLPGHRVELLHHPGLVNQTVGLLIRP